MSASSINCVENPAWTLPPVYGELSRQPFGRNQFDATFNNLITDGVLQGTPKELQDLFGHQRPSLDTPLDLLHGPIKSYEQKMAAREKSVADTLRNFLAGNFAETVQIYSDADKRADDRAKVGTAFLSDADRRTARLMDPNQDVTAPEAVKTRVMSTVAQMALTNDVFVLKVMRKPDDIILPSAEDTGFKGFIAHGAPVMTMNATAQNRAAVSRRRHLSAVENQGGIKPEETAIFSQTTRVITIPPSLIDAGIKKILDDAERAKAEADTVFTEPVRKTPNDTDPFLFNGPGAAVFGHGNEDLARLVNDSIALERQGA